MNLCLSPSGNKFSANRLLTQLMSAKMVIDEVWHKYIWLKVGITNATVANMNESIFAYK